MGKKTSKISDTYKPFENLGSLIKSQSFPLASRVNKKSPKSMDREKPLDQTDHERLFQEAMADVAPMSREAVSLQEGEGKALKAPEQNPEAEALACLEDLVQSGDGFVVSDTSEYMEGIGYGVNPEVARRLHRGDFSIQGHLDLHGLIVEDAKDAFEQFLKEALFSNKRAVLIIHGRGLSSRKEPVLKNKVKQWLASGPWRKWILAFTSARSCDGGAGATYVLLRRHPATKKERKATMER
jgi:DNA-nicking Smr family endonuclease